MHLRSGITLLSIAVVLTVSCTRKEIEFGTVPENNYSRLVYIDSVGINMSTILTDSFAVGGATTYLLGRYKDALLGIVSAKPFFQIDRPAVFPEIPINAIYDSLVLVLKPNDYYYGDTSQLQTIYVHELAQSIVTGYVDKIYNTSSTDIKPTPLGSKTLRIRPVTDDSIVIKLDNAKGLDLFTKIQQEEADVSSSANFIYYFKGISLSTAINDTTDVIGLQSGNSLFMRLYYHTNTPFDQNYFIDFPSLSNTLSYNQVVADRTGTGIISPQRGVVELPSSLTNGYSYTQPGTGLSMKLTFPSLRGILLTNNYLKLLKAELIIRPAEYSYDKYKYKLPSSMELAATDETNFNQGTLTDSTGTGALSATPVIDELYGRDTYYRFNLTSYINTLLQTPGSEDHGLYVIPQFTANEPTVDRFIMGGSPHNSYTTQLRLSVLIVNN